MIYFYNITIQFVDGTAETHEMVTDIFTKNDQLHVWKHTNSYINGDHVGSYPLIHIKKWTRTRR